MLTRLLLFASVACCAVADGLMDEITVECHPHEMKVRLTTSMPFHGLVYPRGLDKKSPCMAEYDVQQGAPFTYTVPLRSCNTMFTDSVLIAFLFIFHRPDDDRMAVASSLTPARLILFILFSVLDVRLIQEDGHVEYFNTIVVQPHRKLVTNQGRGYHVRCRYQTKDTAIISGFNVR
jgi:hypothetical protein